MSVTVIWVDPVQEETMSGIPMPLQLLFLCAFWTPWSRTETHAQQLQQMSQMVYSNFLRHDFHSLNVTDNVTSSLLVGNEVECFFACVKTSLCVSINLAASPDVNKKLQCDLLATDKYSSSDKFQKSSQVHHFSKYSDCEKNPCLNNGTCLPIYEENDYKCKCAKVYRGKHCGLKVSSCADVYAVGHSTSGVYKIDPDGLGAFNVYCDHTVAGGGWTVFQKRFDGSVNFFRGWDEYRQGFGDLNGEFWLGLDKIHRLTNQVQNKLRVDLQDSSDNTAYAEYDSFTIANEENKYRLSVGQYSGTTGDSLVNSHNEMAFSTFDRDNDLGSGENCANRWKGGWWYGQCHNVNLNGLYQPGVNSPACMAWLAWKGTFIGLKEAQMKIRPNSS